MTETPEFAGRRVAVTGGASGIGLGIVESLLAEGAEVFALDLRPGPAGIFVEADVRDPVSLERAAEATGGVDALVACAGVRGPDIAAEDLPIDDFDAVLAVNLRGVFLTCQTFGRRMLAAGAGRIVVIASNAGTSIVPGPMRIIHYNTAKAGVMGMVRTFAVEWAKRGVRINAVSPGYTRTPFLDLDPDKHQSWLNSIPVGRFGEVTEVAAAVRFLLSDGAGFCCGTELLADGGYTLI
ncbi:SDR family NAD(P)-dependent oxidoreductase [Nonomuraea sp. 3N208]|uniref:SDR family NAD(P)-dependent oxidoreductase n=1 Tax=Nonomuraea sp. 3N208 TaxID=3457421 RepID=UPI003FD6B219